jgi:hypothetical protein
MIECLEAVKFGVAHLVSQKLYEEDADVLSAFSERRQCDVGTIAEAVIERRIEPPRGHGPLELRVGGGHDSNIDLPGSCGAQGLDLPVFDNPQQLMLDLDRRQAELVEKESAAGSGLEVARRVGGRTGECALLVPEEFGNRPVRVQQRHIQRDERATAARAGSEHVLPAGWR